LVTPIINFSLKQTFGFGAPDSLAAVPLSVASLQNAPYFHVHPFPATVHPSAGYVHHILSYLLLQNFNFVLK
jgi:hypothetical protein